MGKNSHRRRAQRPLPTDDSQAVVEELVTLACEFAHGPTADKAHFAKVIDALHKREQESDPLDRPSAVVARRLQKVIDNLLDFGWQPADLVHTVKREWTLRASRMVVGFVGHHSRRHEAPTRAPQSWLAQLNDLGVYDPAANVVRGGTGDVLAAWARVERLHPEESLTTAVQILAQLRSAPHVSVLIDPPSAWGATNIGLIERTRTGEVDEKALRLIRAMLAKAEATNFEAEAETFTTKAQELMTRHSIDAAMMASHSKGTAHAAGIESRRVHIDNPYSDEKATFLSAIASVNGVRAVWGPTCGFSTLMGFPVDLRLTDVLFTSLLVQATHASAQATLHQPHLRTAPFRRAFLIAFADRITERLEAARDYIAHDAEQTYGAALVPILAERQAAVDAAYEQAFPNTTARRGRRLDAAGWYAGRAAAERADIGVGEAIARG
ncbi:MAG: DUF2786 domain-containing protein [Actinomycetia bacterium]|nr:DUF2786 domain-containing protein [Actinomycetes bacterium]